MLIGLVKLGLPWLIYAICIAFGNLSHALSLSVALSFFLFLSSRDLRKGYLLSWLTLIFFTSLMMNAIFIHWSVLDDNAASLFYATLAATSWISLFAQAPFSLQYAKNTVPPEKQQHPMFYRINYYISLVWAIIFTVNAMLRYRTPAAETTPILTWVTYGLTVLGVYYTSVFPSWYRRRNRKKA